MYTLTLEACNTRRLKDICMPDYMDRLRALREDSDLTQKQIAQVLGTSQTMYARYERRANELPIRHLIRLCQYYKVSADYVLGLAQPK